MDWARRRILTGELKRRGMTDSKAKELTLSLVPGGRTKKAVDSDVIRRELGESDEKSLTSNFVPQVNDEEEQGGDPVLTRYYDMLQSSRDPKQIDAWGQRINERETFLMRSERMREVRKGSGGSAGPRSNERESLTSNLASNLDISNLAPHADEISKEVIGWVKGMGLIPEQLEGTAVSTLAGVISSHPDIIKKGLDTLGGVLNKYAAKPGAQPGKTGGLTSNFDPVHPELWAKDLGLGV